MTRRSKSTAADNYATAAHTRQRAKHDLDVASDAARTTADAVDLLVRQRDRCDENFEPRALLAAQAKADRAELNVARRADQYAAARINEARVLYRERGAQLALADALVVEARTSPSRATRSSSPPSPRQLRSSTCHPCSRTHDAARSSPRRPRASFSATSTTSVPEVGTVVRRPAVAP